MVQETVDTNNSDVTLAVAPLGNMQRRIMKSLFIPMDLL